MVDWERKMVGKLVNEPCDGQRSFRGYESAKNQDTSGPSRSNSFVS